MWPSAGGPPSRSSSSTCSSPSPFSPSTPSTPQNNNSSSILSSTSIKSMEEVWKDINLPSIVQDQPQLTNSHGEHSNPVPGMILQDFLARSFDSRDPPNTATTGPTNPDHPFFDSFGETVTPLPAPPAPPATILSLNSPGSDPLSRPNQNQPLLQSHFSVGSLSFGSSLSSAFNSLGSSPVFPSSCKKRAQENGEQSGDRRHKRMIKNRESAARSRARKQAYTNELELEVADLREENAKLRRQQERLLAAAAQLPKKHTLCRTLTAPF